jgi:hypothetical protein
MLLTGSKTKKSKMTRTVVVTATSGKGQGGSVALLQTFLGFGALDRLAQHQVRVPDFVSDCLSLPALKHV